MTDTSKPMDPMEAAARVLCSISGNDPDALEPGDALGLDGVNAKGEPCHFLWRHYAEEAQDTARAHYRALAENIPPEMVEAAHRVLEPSHFYSGQSSATLGWARERVKKVLSAAFQALAEGGE